MDLPIEVEASPRTVALAFDVVAVVVIALVLPVVVLQPAFWAGAVGFFVVGDAVTTALFDRYGIADPKPGYTAAICGDRPSLPCALGTRAVVLGVLAAVYVAVFWFGIGAGIDFVVFTALLIPVGLAVIGFAATVVNAHTILYHRGERRAGRSP